MAHSSGTEVEPMCSTGGARQLYDIVVFDKYSQPTAVVEVSGGHAISEE